MSLQGGFIEAEKIQGSVTQKQKLNGALNEKAGLNGKDGISPTIEVSEKEDVVTLEITDKNGTKTVNLDGRTKATAIVQTVQGETVVVDDASNCNLRGLRVFGKSTQDGTPTPDAPVDIVSVGEVEVKIHNKNLFTPTATGHTGNGITFTVNEDKSVTLNGTATARSQLTLGEVELPAGTYVFSQGVSAYGNGCLFGKYTADGTTKYMDFYSSDKGYKEFTITELTRLTIVADVREAGMTVTNLTLYPMVRVASVADDSYEKGNEQSLAIPYTLHGIDDIRDEIDFERGKLIKRYEKLSLAVADMNNSEDYPGWKGIGDLTKYLPSGYNRIVETLVNVGENVSVNVNAGTVYLSQSYYGMTQSTWKANHPNLVVEVLMPLIEPVETDLTAEEIEVYKALHSNYPNTTVMNTAGAVMEVSYNADTKIFVMQNSGSVSDEQIASKVEEYLEENPVEAVTDEQIAQAVANYFVEHPIEGGGTVSAEQIAQAVEDYFTENPVEGGTVTGEQIAQAVENYLAEHPIEGGSDGFSPVANVTQTATGATISIQDKSGTTTATIKNGTDGYTPQKGVDYFDGKDGKDGADGKTPVKGTDYWTTTDMYEIETYCKNYINTELLGGAS